MGNAVTSVKRFILNTCLPLFAKPICILVMMLQMAIMDYFLIVHTSQDIHVRKIDPDIYNTTLRPAEDFPTKAWYLWVIPDAIVIALFITSFVKSHQDWKLSAAQRKQKKEDAGVGGYLPFGYISWLVYSVFLATKVALIFRWTAQTLHMGGLLGIHMLKLGISLCAVVFIMMTMTHDHAEKGSARAAFITLMEHGVMTDLLDTTDILYVIIYEESHVTLTYGIHKAIIFIACNNLILPTVLLIALSKSCVGNSLAWQKRLEVIHKVFYQLLVNLPLLVLRSFLTKVYKGNISVFAIKNVVALGIVVRTIVLKAEDAVKTSKEEEERSSIEMESLNPKGTGSDEGKPETRTKPSEEPIDTEVVTPGKVTSAKDDKEKTETTPV